MKPRIGVYLSEQMAARLTVAAKRPGASKSALVEAALAQFFGSDDDSDNLPVDNPKIPIELFELAAHKRKAAISREIIAIVVRTEELSKGGLNERRLAGARTVGGCR